MPACPYIPIPPDTTQSPRAVAQSGRPWRRLRRRRRRRRCAAAPSLGAALLSTRPRPRAHARFPRLPPLVETGQARPEDNGRPRTCGRTDRHTESPQNCRSLRRSRVWAAEPHPFARSRPPDRAVPCLYAESTLLWQAASGSADATSTSTTGCPTLALPPRPTLGPTRSATRSSRGCSASGSCSRNGARMMCLLRV